MATPGTSSGTQSFFLSNSEVIFEALDRAHIRPPEVTRHHLISARRSMNLELQAWSNRGINLWEEVSAQLILLAGQATYTLPNNLVTITEMYFTTINGNGVGFNSDRIMVPITRAQYAMIPNKLQPGQPSQYWLQRLEQPVVNIWQPAFQGAPNYVINYNYLQRIDDVGIGSGETPDIVYRALDALCAGVAFRIAVKFSPAQEAVALVPFLKAEAKEAWDMFVTNDQEDGPIIMQPNFGGYARMRR
jgi:hypothetical protein